MAEYAENKERNSRLARGELLERSERREAGLQGERRERNFLGAVHEMHRMSDSAERN